MFPSFSLFLLSHQRPNTIIAKCLMFLCLLPKRHRKTAFFPTNLRKLKQPSQGCSHVLSNAINLTGKSWISSHAIMLLCPLFFIFYFFIFADDEYTPPPKYHNCFLLLDSSLENKQTRVDRLICLCKSCPFPAYSSCWNWHDDAFFGNLSDVFLLTGKVDSIDTMWRSHIQTTHVRQLLRYKKNLSKTVCSHSSVPTFTVCVVVC